MKGLELARKYYEEYGRKMIEEQFAEIADRIAVGLTGSGSECYGYDDELSQDHDFEPGFCIFLPDESVVDERTAFQLERAYNKLPREFEGYSRSLFQPAGGNRHGVFRAAEYYLEKTGSPDGQLSAEQWLSIDDSVLAEATNGEIFRDDSDLVNGIRANFTNMPQDVFLKRLAGNVMVMSQSGQYNYNRLLQRQESAAAQLALYEYVRSAMKVVFLLNRAYMPFYKWSFRALRSLNRLSITAEIFEFLLTGNNDEENAAAKKTMMESADSIIIEELVRQGLLDREEQDLSRAANLINGKIANNDLRNLDILVAVH